MDEDILNEAAADRVIRDATLTFWVVSEDAFPHGLACIECHRSIDIGKPYVEKLNGFVEGGIPVSHLVCVYC